MKNPTPRQIAIGTSLLISVLLPLLIAVFFLLTDVYIDWYFFVILPFIIFVISYLLFLYALELFIYRKIKLIYKIISRAKTTKEVTSSKLNMNRDIISEVEEEVLESTQQEVQELEQLRQLEEYRKQFLGNVSHELKTPIFHIQGYIETLLDGGIKDGNINIKYLKKASQNVDRLNAIISDLEMISLIEDGKLNLEMEDFNLWELISEIFDSLSLLANKNDVELKFKKGFFNPCFVRGDKEQINQVFVNLLTNAIKYNKVGGKVTVGTYDLDEKILIEVTDNGIGIDGEHLPRIFERFYRVSKSRSREKGGTGLGLSIVKHILEAHGQNITVRSTIGKGTTFDFTLDKAKISSGETKLL